MLGRVAPAALALAVLALPLAAQKKKLDDPAGCPWCHNDPALLEKAKLVSHGPFPFSKYDTKKSEELLPEVDFLWLETEHFRIGFTLGEHKVKLEEKKKILAELTRLKEVFPDVKPETQILQPWMRLHLYAQRCEETYTRFCQILHLDGTPFADGTGVWAGSYRGEGPYLGMKEKYEVLVLPSEASHVRYMIDQTGRQTRLSQRWHFIDRGCISIIAHAQQGRLRTDGALHGHIAFNLAHNLLDGLNHYSYDTPIWFHEGLAHVLEREIDPNHNSFDSGEGATAETTSKANWKPEVLKLINNGEAPRLAELMTLKSYAELKLRDHFATWSMVDFLLQAKPDEFAKFLWKMKNNKDERGVPTGANLPEWHRTAFKEAFGWSYPEFDEAWRAWAKEAYKPGIPKGSEGGSVIPGTNVPSGGGG